MNTGKEFLQSEEWILFQSTTRKDVIRFFQDGFSANGIIHPASLIGKYLYVPRGPILNNDQSPKSNHQKNIEELVKQAEEKNAKWIRIEPENDDDLEKIRESFNGKIVRAPHDVQPKEIFVIDITKDEESILAQMKSKTRYNIRLAEKHGVKTFATREEKYKQAFFDLIEATADRKEISPHSRSYYEKFFEIFPEEMCQLFVAEHENKVLVANILIIFEGRAIYLHGGSSSEHRDVMAPYLLQWKQIQYAKERGCVEYDFGGVKMMNQESGIKNLEKNNWEGITRFKIGFSPETERIVFPGAYDMILDPMMYRAYIFIRALRKIFK
ncbi:MAG: peptidoglycan bridge formation glycyltransferase FemA/FemB family protein [Candidatus Moraniibacteriota bacterium]